MKSTNVSLCAFKVFLIEFGFAIVGYDGEPVFDEKTMHQILNFDAMDISVNGSKTIVGGRPEVSFHDPHLTTNAKFDFCKVIA
jgi:hypothetical protein